jgi:urea transport system permease protein
MSKHLAKLRVTQGLLLLCLLGPAAASPDEALEGLVKALAGASFTEKIEITKSIAATGDPRAVGILTALVNSKLYRRKQDDRIVIGEKQGKAYRLKDAFDLAELEQASSRDLKKVRVNNRLRSVVRGLLGGLTLLSPDPRQRLRAAKAVFESRDPQVLGTLETALAQEEDTQVLGELQLALAAIQAGDPRKAVRLEGIRTLGDSAEPKVRSLLAPLLFRDADGRYREADVDVRNAAKGALANIDAKIANWERIESLFQGISLGSVLLLAAIGLAITFGVMGVINMAHGEMVMLGAYTTFLVQGAFSDYWPAASDYSLLAAIPAAFVLAGSMGILIERSIIRHLYGRALETLLATWGVSLILQQLVRSLFGPTNKEVSIPPWMSGAMELSGGLVLTYNRIWIFAFCLCVFAGLILLLKRSTFGLQTRAVAQNRSMANSMGINTGKVDALTFGLGSGVAGLAGVALSQIDNVSPNLGQSYIIDSFMVVVFGGVGNLWGTLVGAFSLGILNKFLEPSTGAVLGKILILVGIILFIQKRPRGLFPPKGRAAES